MSRLGWLSAASPPVPTPVPSVGLVRGEGRGVRGEGQGAWGEGARVGCVVTRGSGSGIGDRGRGPGRVGAGAGVEVHGALR